MGLFFKSNEHLFTWFEKSSIEKKFLNIFKLVKPKYIEFLSRYENEDKDFHTLAYDFLILKKKVTFTARKITIYSMKSFQDRYNSFGNYLMSGKYYEGKLVKGGDSFVGLPEARSDYFPYTLLELDSHFVGKKNREKNNFLRDIEYLQLHNLNNGWRKEVEKGFNEISDKVIKETLKQLNGKIKPK